jgi:hypothetical protein
LNTLKTRNLFEENLVSIKKVKAFTFEKLIKEFEIERINMIKVDAEGFDCKNYVLEKDIKKELSEIDNYSDKIKLVKELYEREQNQTKKLNYK